MQALSTTPKPAVAARPQLRTTRRAALQVAKVRPVSGRGRITPTAIPL